MRNAENIGDEQNTLCVSGYVSPDFVFVKVGRKMVKVWLCDILYIESKANYVQITTVSQIYLVMVSMKALYHVLPNNIFCRISRGIIINMSQIKEFDSKLVKLESGQVFEFGENGKKELIQRVVVL